MDSLLKPLKEQKCSKNLLPNETVGYKSVSKMLSSIHGGTRGDTNLNQQNAKNKSAITVQPKVNTAYHRNETFQQINITNKYRNENSAHFNVLTQGDKLNEKKVYWNSSRNFPRNLSPSVMNWNSSEQYT